MPMPHPVRDTLFISHANPEDNQFALWLGSKLSAMGYRTWADILELRGGQDWQRELEHVIRNRAKKILFVGTAKGAQKQGVRNELQIAADVAKRTGDDAFIVPLRLEHFEAPFVVAHAQYIDFAGGWMRGFQELIDTLRNTYGVPTAVTAKTDHWRAIQLRNATVVQAEPEPLISTWLRVSGLPKWIRYHSSRPSTADHRCIEPISPFGDGYFSFAESDPVVEARSRSIWTSPSVQGRFSSG